MDEYYAISDLDEFVDSIRKIIYTGFGKNDNEIKDNNFISNIQSLSSLQQQELEEVLSLNECMIIVKQYIKTQINKNTREYRYVLTDTIFETMIQELNTRLVSNLLRTLVNKGLIESSFDSEANDFVFWVKDDNEV